MNGTDQHCSIICNYKTYYIAGTRQTHQHSPSRVARTRQTRERRVWRVLHKFGDFGNFGEFSECRLELLNLPSNNTAIISFEKIYSYLQPKEYYALCIS